MPIEYHEFRGEVSFVYREKIDSSSYRYFSGKIPKSVVEQGKSAVRAYANRKVNRAKIEWKNGEDFERSIQESPIPITAGYKDGTKLEGVIDFASSRYIGVKLIRPVESESGINFGMASAMAKHYVFDGCKISDAGFDGARTALIWAYEKVLNKSS